MFTETKSQQYLKFPHASSKFVKMSAIICYDFLSLCQFWQKLRKQWLTFNKFDGGTCKLDILLRFSLSERTLALFDLVGAHYESPYHESVCRCRKVRATWTKASDFVPFDICQFPGSQFWSLFSKKFIKSNANLAWYFTISK